VVGSILPRASSTCRGSRGPQGAGAAGTERSLPQRDSAIQPFVGVPVHLRRRPPRAADQEHEALPQGDPALERTLGEIRSILYELGREALNENAEWLISPLPATSVVSGLGAADRQALQQEYLGHLELGETIMA